MASPRSRMGRGPQGFTLIELLVAIGLATILVGTVALIFHGSTDIFKTSESRIAIYGNARAAMDIVARDISSMLPREGGQQRMCTENKCFLHQAGAADSSGDVRGDAAIDTIQFRAIVPINSTRRAGGAGQQLTSPTLMTVHVLYMLALDDDPEILTNDSTVRATVERNAQTPNGRPLFVLRKRAFDIPTLGNGNAAGTVTANVDPAVALTPASAVQSLLTDEQGDLCHYVLSMNIEWINSTQPVAGQIVNANPGTWNTIAIGTIANPVGLTLAAPITPLPQALRITLRVAEGAGVRQERIITRVVWIPLS
ncbi:MAG: prepilin-type N-terminal cleavage/methylation domain-containing protein [Planctomycetes bacterium]|nr:prepilin-type N-terminal cleavage/methylation domain-containing protein [Planctomycetota bacterium]